LDVQDEKDGCHGGLFIGGVGRFGERVNKDEFKLRGKLKRKLISNEMCWMVAVPVSRVPVPA
jgi:hypothetical protein